MKPKQLANVLIKILGLSMCAHGLPSLMVSLIYGVGAPISGHEYIYAMFPQLIMGLVPVAIGIFLIVRSRWVTEKLFSDEAE